MTKKPSKSTATAAQYDRLIQRLRLGPHNTYELRRAGIMMPAARVKELNDRHGYDIRNSGTVTVVDQEGFSHRGVATYSLISEPACNER